MNGPERGYLTLATGPEAFLEMAVDMTLSLREHTRLPIALATDDRLAAVVDERFSGVFDRVTRIPQRFLHGRTRKYGVAEASPFDETVFIDADCFVLGRLDQLFAALAGQDVAMLGEQLDRDDDENHHGFSTRRLIERFGLERYLKTNSGVFAFRTRPAVEVMEAFRACHVDEIRPRLRWSILKGAWLGDEIAIGVVGGRLGLGTLPPPHVMYWPQEFDSLDPDRPAKPLLHLIWPPPRPVVNRLMGDVRRRRERAGVPRGSEPAWRSEIAKLQRMAWRRRVLERSGWW